MRISSMPSRIAEPSHKTGARPTMVILGAHRGSGAFEQNFAGSPMSCTVVDNHPGRAEALALALSRKGHRASFSQLDARQFAPATSPVVLTLCTDDPSVQLQHLLQSEAQLTVVAAMISAPVARDGGGPVLGFGAIIPRDCTEAKKQALRIFRRLNILAGGKRTSSRIMRAPQINEMQAKSVRQALYRQLAISTHSFLSGKPLMPSLFVSSCWPTPKVAEASVVDVKLISGSSLREQIRNQPSNSTIVFLDPENEPWLCLAQKEHNRIALLQEIPPVSRSIRGMPGGVPELPLPDTFRFLSSPSPALPEKAASTAMEDEKRRREAEIRIREQAARWLERDIYETPVIGYSD